MTLLILKIEEIPKFIHLYEILIKNLIKNKCQKHKKRLRNAHTFFRIEEFIKIT